MPIVPNTAKQAAPKQSSLCHFSSLCPHSDFTLSSLGLFLYSQSTPGPSPSLSWDLFSLTYLWTMIQWSIMSWGTNPRTVSEPCCLAQTAIWPWDEKGILMSYLGNWTQWHMHLTPPPSSVPNQNCRLGLSPLTLRPHTTHPHLRKNKHFQKQIMHETFHFERQVWKSTKQAKILLSM